MRRADVRTALFAALVIVAFPVVSLSAQDQSSAGATAAQAAVAPASPVGASASRPDALQAYRNQNYSEAIRITRQEIGDNPKNVDSYVVLGWSQLALGSFQDALTTATSALSFAPGDPRLMEIAGEADYRLGKYQDALRYFQLYVTNATGSGNRLIDDVYYFMGEIYIKLGQYNRADTAITTAVHFEPSDPNYWTRLGYAREKAGEYARAADAYRKALSLNAGASDASAGLQRVQAAR